MLGQVITFGVGIFKKKMKNLFHNRVVVLLGESSCHTNSLFSCKVVDKELENIKMLWFRSFGSNQSLDVKIES